MSVKNKGSYYNQNKWLERSVNSGLYYRGALDGILDNASDTSRVENQQGDKTQENKGIQITESNENFDC